MNSPVVCLLFFFFSAKSCLFCKLGAHHRQTAAIVTWVAPTPWTRPCCCSTASTMGSPGMSSHSTSQRTSPKLRGCPITSPCKCPEGKSTVCDEVIWTNITKSVVAEPRLTNPDLQSCVTVSCWDNWQNLEPGIRARGNREKQLNTKVLCAYFPPSNVFLVL